MNTASKFMFAFVLLVVFLSNTMDAAAMQPGPDETAGANNLVQSDLGDRAQWLMPEVQEKRGPSCSKANMPRLSYYLDDDGTPVEVAYSDYLEDLDHWRYWTDDNCNIKPETLPAQ